MFASCSWIFIPTKSNKNLFWRNFIFSVNIHGFISLVLWHNHIWATIIWCLSFLSLFISITSCSKYIFGLVCQYLSLKFWIIFIDDFSRLNWIFWIFRTYWTSSLVYWISSWLNNLRSNIVNFLIWNSLVRTFDTSLNLFFNTLRLPSLLLIISC